MNFDEYLKSLISANMEFSLAKMWYSNAHGIAQHFYITDEKPLKLETWKKAYSPMRATFPDTWN